MMSVGVLTFVAVARHSNAEAGAASGVVGIGSMTSAPSSMLAFGLYFGFTLTSLTRLHGRPRRESVTGLPYAGKRRCRPALLRARD
jgi:hypothetical protein